MEKKWSFINGHNFFFWNFRETTRHFSLRSQNSEYPRIFQATGANQNARKLLSTDLVNTYVIYYVASSASGQDEPNPALWLATRAFLPARDCPFFCRNNISPKLKRVHESFLSQNILCDSKKHCCVGLKNEKTKRPHHFSNNWLPFQCSLINK